jgi:hypothetical protein
MTWESHSLPPRQAEPTSLPPPPAGSKRMVMKRVEQAILKQAEIEWRRFPGLPGKHLALKKSGWHSWEYADTTTGLAEMRCEASSQTRFPKSVFYQGRVYEWRRVGKRKVMQAARVRDLVDLRANLSVLRRTGRHFDSRAGTRIVTPRVELSFPVKGWRPCAVMSAIDGSGNHLIEYRSIKWNSNWTSEIVINPEFLTLPQIHPIVAVSSRLIFDFFATGGGA